eukprot:CAMPEP_0170603770 /NCGR_PEP_ID=MMETSP0224-20130122/19082_1 /TAXON_ID=285029 /ORGANISM="Togula jolla, Strain CCCM 725" /LENGTH=411 /DNA_ID=CAMNT_0010928659 /DNA_START=36 /DNA_END=1271 /DNA_ORIENTATION=+
MAGRGASVIFLGSAAAAGLIAVRLLLGSANGSALPPSFVQATGLSTGSREPLASGIAQGRSLRGVSPVEPSSTGVPAAAMLAAAFAATGLAISRAGLTRTRSTPSGSAVVACQATPRQIPVLDTSGKQVGEETLNFKTLSPETANYVVHQVYTVWEYMNLVAPRKIGNYALRRGDVKRGKKPWAQKGTGRARAGSRYSPLFGKVGTNKVPHGADNIRNKKVERNKFYMALSTVLQSKWRGTKIITGLEDYFEDGARQGKMEKLIEEATGVEAGKKSMLMITRSGYGTEDSHDPTMSDHSSKLYLSGRNINKFSMRRPRDIDPTSDGIFHALKGRRIIMSREAFFDLKAKFDADEGWAWMTERDILAKQLQQIVKEYPLDREAELEAARMLAPDRDGREFWAKQTREELSVK